MRKIKLYIKICLKFTIRRVVQNSVGHWKEKKIWKSFFFFTRERENSQFANVVPRTNESLPPTSHEFLVFVFSLYFFKKKTPRWRVRERISCTGHLRGGKGKKTERKTAERGRGRIDRCGQTIRSVIPRDQAFVTALHRGQTVRRREPV